MSEELPQGWAETTVGEVAEDISYGFTAKATTEPVGPRLLRITDIQNGSVEWNSVPYCEIPKGKAANYSLRDGDIVFARTGATTGKSFRIRSCPEAVFASYLIRVRPSQSTLPEFLAHFFQSASYWNQISENLSGSAQPNCNASKLATISMPLAPLPEQRRIVAKLTELLGKVDASQQRLAKIPVLLKRFRQSVLAAACSGRLTADWREENSNCEDALALVQKIDAARRPTSGEQPKKIGKSKSEELMVDVLRDADCPDSTIPDSWVWVRFGSVIGELRNGVGLRPNNQPPGIPMLRSSAVRQGSVDLNDYRHMPNGQRFLPAFAVRNRDLFFTRYSGSMEFVGACAMVRGLGKTTLLYPDKLMRVRFDHDFILPEYAEVFFQAVEAHERIVAKSKSSAGQNGVSGSDIKAQPLALAPLPEQQEIVRRVARLFALADQLDERLVKARGQVEKLTPSLLARAFAGQLVPQDPTDEPAEKLLERIKT